LRPFKNRGLFAPSERAHWVVVCLLTGLWIVFLALHAGSSLEVAELSRIDEFLTFIRSRSILENGDAFCLFVNGKVNFNKPPLQYWLSATLLSEGVRPVLAVRIPSLVFGLLTLLMTALFAVQLSHRKDPWVALASVLFLSTSLLFQEHLGTGMLETGLTFFLVSSLYFLNRAERDTRWWLPWALACGLGALHKIPLALLFSGIYLFVVGKRHGGLTKVIRDRCFQWALLLALILTSLWPVSQLLRFGSVFLSKTHGESLGRFTSDASSVDFSRFGWLLVDGSMFWCLTLITLAASTVFFKGLIPDARLRGILAILAFVALLIVLGNRKIYPRYWLCVTPMMAALTSVLLSEMSKKFWLAPLLAFACFTYQGARVAVVPFAKAKDQGHLFSLRCATRRLYERMGCDQEGFLFVKKPLRTASISEVPPPRRLHFKREELPTDSRVHYGIVGQTWLRETPDRIEIVKVQEEFGAFSLVQFKMRH